MTETPTLPRFPTRFLAGLLSALLWVLPIDFGGGSDIPTVRLSLRHAFAQSPTIAGELAVRDIATAVEGIRDLGDFFARLARNDPNRFAARHWGILQATYAEAARQLDDLLKQSRIRVDSLPAGTASLIDRESIVVDREVAGRWLPRHVRSARRSGDAWQYTSLLSTLLLQDLLRLNPESGRAWFREHLARSTLAETAPSEADPRLARHLAGFWHIKDKHLRLAMLGDGTTDPELRRLIDGRKIDLLSEIRSTATALERDLGSDWAERLWLDWRDYDTQIRLFSSLRSWLLTTRRATPEPRPPEQPAEVRPLKPKPKPRALGWPPPPSSPVEPVQSAEARVAEMAAALEESRVRASRREARLLADLAAVRQTLEAVETARAESAEKASDLRNALTVERADSEDLRARLEAERQASRDRIARLEQDMTAQLEASEQLVSEVSEQLAAEQAAGQTARTELEAELEAERQASRDRLDQLELDMTARLEASAQLVSELSERLAAEQAAGQTARAELEAELAAERQASRDQIARLEQDTTARLEAGAQLVSQLRAQLAAERAASETARAGLEAELAAERQASRGTVEQVEEQLAAERAASQEEIARIRRNLSAEMASDREQAARREEEVVGTLESERQVHARRVAGLSAELASSRETITQLRQRVAELEAAPAEVQPAPESTTPEERGFGAWLTFAAPIALLALVGLAAIVVVRRRNRLPGRAPTPEPRPSERPAAPALGPTPPEAPAARPEEDTTPQTVVEALRRGDIALFEARFAELAGLKTNQLDRILHRTSGEELAILCRALGMDKLFLASIFLLSHKDDSAESKIGPRDLSRVTAFYDRITDDSARKVLEEWQRDPGLPGVIKRLRAPSGSGDAPGQSGAAE